MSKEPRAKRQVEHNHLHHDHDQAHRDHAIWMEDVDRWRDEYHEAAMAFVRRAAPELELEEFEAAIDAHEAATKVPIEIHEQALARHESALHLEREGTADAAGGFRELHRVLDLRHEQTRQAHQSLDLRFQKIIKALSGSNDR